MMHFAIIVYSITTVLSGLSCTSTEDIPSERIHLPNSSKESGRLDFQGLALKYGYTSEQYDVVTEDGYILTLFHIPGKSPLPVLLMHGVLDSAETWLYRGKGSLGITLAKLGYDVWFGNSRGNRYSRRHIFLNPDKNILFWRFSFHEVGYFDLPAIIDRVLNLTGAPSVSAIGHSQGTTAFYVLGSTKPQYNSKVNVFIALAPVCYLHHSPPPISTFIMLLPLVQKFVTKFGIYEFLGDNSTATQILREICPLPVIGYSACILGLLFPFTGYDSTELEPSFARNVAEYFPAGTSTRSLIHYLQVGSRRIFAPYDSGVVGNQLEYNSTVPPPYALSKVTFPVALLAAKNDPLSTIPDVDLLRGQLPNVVYYLINHRSLFNHADHIWGRRMRSYLFPYILRLLRRYNRFH